MPHQRAQIAGQGLGAARPQGDEIFGHHRIGGALPPQIGRDFAEQFAIVGEQFRRSERLAAFQRVFAQHARAKTVDGEHRSQIDFFHRLLQAATQGGGRFAGAGQMRGEDGAGEQHVGCCV